MTADDLSARLALSQNGSKVVLSAYDESDEEEGSGSEEDEFVIDRFDIVSILNILNDP